MAHFMCILSLDWMTKNIFFSGNLFTLKIFNSNTMMFDEKLFVTGIRNSALRVLLYFVRVSVRVVRWNDKSSEKNIKRRVFYTHIFSVSRSTGVSVYVFMYCTRTKFFTQYHINLNPLLQQTIIQFQTNINLNDNFQPSTWCIRKTKYQRNILVKKKCLERKKKPDWRGTDFTKFYHWKKGLLLWIYICIFFKLIRNEWFSGAMTVLNSWSLINTRILFIWIP